MFGKSYIDSEFISHLEKWYTKEGDKYFSWGTDWGWDYVSHNIKITKKKGYVYVSSDYNYRDTEGFERNEVTGEPEYEETPLGKMKFKFKQDGNKYYLKGVKFTPAQ
ncbi:MAG: hypothetical protein K6G81_06360 [Lachnospiraceae bacterium]|nr:hypothetical protein [Lachnospiraceae bacterium]